MIQLEVGGRRHPVPAGEFVVGSDAACDLQVGAEGVLPRHALLLTGEQGTAVRRAVEAADILVNGVKLGTDPTPILHGDKVQLGAVELFVVDPKRVGNTQMMSAIELPATGGPPAARPGAGGASGGRLVCLTDGREYMVGDEPLVFGRDAGCDVVVGGSEVSRRHADIRSTPDGYVLTDASVNGTYVNGDRVTGSRVLARADVIRIGPDEFRFYADARPASAPPPSTPSIPAAPPLGAAQRLVDTMHGVPATPIPRPGSAPEPIRLAPPLASLLVRSGALKGQRLAIRTPVANIGRADYNDVVLADSSVSITHAKLQRRDGVWVITDLGSTNGTTVEGETVTGEMPLTPGATIKFGEVAVLFEPADEAMEPPASGTRVMQRLVAERPAGGRDGTPPAKTPVKTPAPPAAPRPRSRRPVVGTARRRSGIPTWLIVAALGAAAAAAAAFTMLKR